MLGNRRFITMLLVFGFCCWEVLPLMAMPRLAQQQPGSPSSGEGVRIPRTSGDPGQTSLAQNNGGTGASKSNTNETHDLDSLLDADLEELAQAEVTAPVFGEEVTTVDRQESTVGRSAAAIYVITGDMIRRSGARSIPEALRLAPGVQVARIDANKWAISIRGLNERFSNKLLVQIDGRTSYTPLFGGVFWDVQDVLLEDVDRIEVIRGPGASVWGANAVNGVINVITKSAEDTQGIFVESGAGDQRGFGSARVGGKSGNMAWRTYGKWFERDTGISPTGRASDDWRMSRLGFRSDWQPTTRDSVTLQGDYYDGDAGQFQVTPTSTAPFVERGPDDQVLAGGNVLMSWTRELHEESDWRLQFYYDRTERTIEGINFREDRDTVDVDFQHRYRWAQRHKLIWGAAYRNSRDQIRNADFQIQFHPSSRADDLFSIFVQDEMTLVEDLLFGTVGSKFSWNDYTGFEGQPTARLLYTPTKRQTIWGSVSRAVRIPSRSDDDVRLVLLPSDTPIFPTFPIVFGDRSIDSEKLVAWEAGMRSAPTEHTYWDLAAFYNRYHDLASLRAGAPGFDPDAGALALPLTFFNGLNATGYGFEMAYTWEANPMWTLRGDYSFLRLDLDADAGVFGSGTSAEGESPRNQFTIHSSWDLGCNCEFDLIGRYVDVLPAIDIPSYYEMDARLAWRSNWGCEFALVGRNLLDGSHPEFASDTLTGAVATEVPRELYGSMTWRY